MTRAALALLLSLTATTTFAATTSNNDSCDIALQPAATLLLPYFEQNATIFTETLLSPPPPPPPSLPAASTVPTSSAVFPVPFVLGHDVGGWIYLNLNNGGSAAYSTARHSQNWVITTMFADPTFATEEPALALANGCTPAPARGAQIGPP
jgi:hypothetical protein